MKRAVIVLPEAGSELTQAQDWYEAEARGLGARFRAEVDSQDTAYVIACFHSSLDPGRWQRR